MPIATGRRSSHLAKMYQVPDQLGRRIVITGANSGTGKEAALRLAAAGADVVMAVRSLDKGRAARNDIVGRCPAARLELRHLDLADLSSVRSFAGELLADGRPIHTLVNNAGVMAPPSRHVSPDGFELQFATNFLGPFALTNLLLPRLLESAGARVVTMTSMVAHLSSINWADLQWQRRYATWPAYGQSKLADMLFGMRLAEIARAKGWSLLSTLAHPGYTSTNLQNTGPNLGTGRRQRPLIFRLVPGMDVREGTEPLLHAIAAPDARQGEYYGPRLIAWGRTHITRIPTSARREDASRLWSLAEDLSGVALPN